MSYDDLHLMLKCNQPKCKSSLNWKTIDCDHVVCTVLASEYVWETWLNIHEWRGCENAHSSHVKIYDISIDYATVKWEVKTTELGIYLDGWETYFDSVVRSLQKCISDHFNCNFVPIAFAHSQMELIKYCWNFILMLPILFISLSQRIAVRFCDKSIRFCLQPILLSLCILLRHNRNKLRLLWNSFTLFSGLIRHLPSLSLSVDVSVNVHAIFNVER